VLRWREKRDAQAASVCLDPVGLTGKQFLLARGDGLRQQGLIDVEHQIHPSLAT
jgi:hypothetical protein